MTTPPIKLNARAWTPEATLEEVLHISDQLEAVVVIAVHKDGAYQTTSSNIMLPKLCMVSKVLDKYVADLLRDSTEDAH